MRSEATVGVRAVSMRTKPYLDFPQRVEELVVAVGEHVQLVACVSLGLLLGLGDGGLVAWC